jgi:hypothetical protein
MGLTVIARFLEAALRQLTMEDSSVVCFHADLVVVPGQSKMAVRRQMKTFAERVNAKAGWSGNFVKVDALEAGAIAAAVMAVTVVKEAEIVVKTAVETNGFAGLKTDVLLSCFLLAG